MQINNFKSLDNYIYRSIISPLFYGYSESLELSPLKDNGNMWRLKIGRDYVDAQHNYQRERLEKTAPHRIILKHTMPDVANYLLLANYLPKTRTLELIDPKSTDLISFKNKQSIQLIISAIERVFTTSQPTIRIAKINGSRTMAEPFNANVYWLS